MGGISIWQLLIVLVIVLLLFGAKKLRNAGSDLGAAVKGFKNAVGDAEQNVEKSEAQKLDNNKDDDVIDVSVAKKENVKKDS